MFLFRLAGHLKKTVAELEQDLSHREFIEWVAFSKIEPIGDARNDYLFGCLMQTLVSCHSTTKFKLSDFIPDWIAENKPATAEQMINAFAVMGNKVKVVKNG